MKSKKIIKIMLFSCHFLAGIIVAGDFSQQDTPSESNKRSCLDILPQNDSNKKPKIDSAATIITSPQNSLASLGMSINKRKPRNNNKQPINNCQPNISIRNSGFNTNTSVFSSQNNTQNIQPTNIWGAQQDNNNFQQQYNTPNIQSMNILRAQQNANYFQQQNNAQNIQAINNFTTQQNTNSFQQHNNAQNIQAIYNFATQQNTNSFQQQNNAQLISSINSFF